MGQEFQAVGVVGIAAGVGYFASQRHASPYPYGAIKIESWQGKRLLQVEHAALRALAHESVIAKFLYGNAGQFNTELPASIVALAQVPDAHNQGILDMSPSSNLNQIEKMMEAKLIANTGVNRARRNSEVLQAFVVVLGTLQSGLGTYLIEMIKRVA